MPTLLVTVSWNTLPFHLLLIHSSYLWTERPICPEAVWNRPGMNPQQLISQWQILGHLTSVWCHMLFTLFTLQVKKQQLELDMEQHTSSKLGKECVKAVYCHPAYLTYMQGTSRETLGWMKYKLESRLPGKLSITSDMQMTPPLWQKVKRN